MGRRLAQLGLAFGLGLALWGLAATSRAAEPLVVVAQVEGVIDPINSDLAFQPAGQFHQAFF